MASSSQQLKQGLLLHVQMNRNFIDQKVYKQFGQQCLKQVDINALNRKKMLTVIKFIFDFGSNQGMKQFYQKLQKNIEDFIKTQKQTKPKNSKGNVPIDLQNLVELIIYCVHNGFQYQKKQIIKPIKQPPKLQPQIQKKPIQSPKKDLPIKKQPPKKQQQPVQKQEKKKPQITLLNPQLQAKVDKIKLIVKPLEPIKAPAKVSTRLDPDKIPSKVSEFKLQKYEKPNLNVGPKYLQSLLPPKPKVQESTQISNCQPLDLSYLQSEHNKKLMRERLLKIYQHYCRQQQNNGHSATFDKIKSQLEHMNLGKFLMFCSLTNVFKDSQKINKNYLSATFKKQAGGMKEINFDNFQILIQEIDKKFIKQKTSLNGSSFQVPTYHSRLRLNTNQGYKQVIKLINFVFNTKDDIKNKKDNQIFKGQLNTNRDLTGHSGKFEMDLYEHINNRKGKTIQVKDQVKKQVLLTENRERIRSLPRHKPINMQQMHRKQWPKISWLQQQIKKSQQVQIHEDLMPRISSRRKDVVGNLKKRLEQVSKMELK